MSCNNDQLSNEITNFSIGVLLSTVMSEHFDSISPPLTYLELGLIYLD